MYKGWRWGQGGRVWTDLWNPQRLEGIEGKRHNILHTELKKIGSTGSTLPEHQRFSQGTHKARHYLKDVWIAFQAICSCEADIQINCVAADLRSASRFCHQNQLKEARNC